MFKNNLPSGKAIWDICLTFLQVFSVSIRFDSDLEHHQDSLLYS